MPFAPQGSWGPISERYDVTLFPIRHRLVVDGGDSEGWQPKPVRD